MLLKDLAEGMYYEALVQVVRVNKPGPYVFTVTDGDSRIEVVFGEQKVSREYRPYEIVHIKGKAVYRYERLQLEGEHITSSSGSLDGLEESVRVSLSVSSDIFEQMRPQLERCAIRIKEALLSRQPVLLRFHGDADGIASALALQQGMREAAKAMGLDALVYTSVNPTPVYDTQSMLRDVSHIEGYKQTPLCIFADMGSAEDNDFGIRSLRLSSSDVIVLDHHPPADSISEVAHHCNPHLYDTGSDITAGMLCYELARMLAGSSADPLLPAVAACGDKSQGQEARQYMEGYEESTLKDYVMAFDFVAFHLRFDTGDRLYPLLLRDKQFLSLISQKARSQMNQALQEMASLVKKESLSVATLVYADIENLQSYIYPSKGRLMGALFEQYAGAHEGAVIVVGQLSNMCILRSTHEWLHTLGKHLQGDFPSVPVETRGHAKAGTLRMPGIAKEHVLEGIRAFLS